jgi:hypothetical protein
LSVGSRKINTIQTETPRLQSWIPGTAAAALAGTGRARADYATVVDPSTDYGAWEGWGASLSWWKGA